MAVPVSKYFDIPRLYYFESGNVFTGSREQTFNYKITPKDMLKVQIWYGLMCSDKSEIVSEQEFTKDQAGFDEMIKWLEEQFDKKKAQENA